jgi:hypothetical protein
MGKEADPADPTICNQLVTGFPMRPGIGLPTLPQEVRMQRLPELRMPNDWKLRTRVFVSRAKPRPGLAPLVSREVYDAERPPARAGKGSPRPGRADDRALRDLFALWRQ